MTQPRHRCPACGREVAQQGGTYGTPEQLYAYLYPHRCKDGEWRYRSIPLAVKLRKRPGSVS